MAGSKDVDSLQMLEKARSLSRGTPLEEERRRHMPVP